MVELEKPDMFLNRQKGVSVVSKTYNLFVSHSWSYGKNYDNLIRLLENRPYFSFRDYSVPKDDPIHTNGTDRQLYEAIKRQVAPCHAVVILAGVYATYSKWINKELEIAKKGFIIPKPVIAVELWGAERTSTVVKANADRIVKWNTESIVSAIRELA
jgi:hypothetical protein